MHFYIIDYVENGSNCIMLIMWASWGAEVEQFGGKLSHLRGKLPLDDLHGYDHITILLEAVPVYNLGGVA